MSVGRRAVRRWCLHHKVGVSDLMHVHVSNLLFLVPLAQRQHRRRKEVSQIEEQNCEKEDLKFIETLGKPDDASPDEIEEEPSEEAGRKGTVVVVDIKKETQNLEDWLDDFLDD